MRVGFNRRQQLHLDVVRSAVLEFSRSPNRKPPPTFP